MGILAALTEEQLALLACLGLLFGSTVILAMGYAFGRWTGRNMTTDRKRECDEPDSLCLSDAMIDCGAAHCRRHDRAA